MQVGPNPTGEAISLVCWPRLLDSPTGATAELYPKQSPPTETTENVPVSLSGLSVRVSELKERINTTVCVNARKAGASERGGGTW
jgi:hypothetical protein